ncbi:MAG: sugar phosphate nucleotidyltransferase [Candidatus Omnitrophica bacterium]|nr:sugar phosphate nucleotidyltransferase [Candidatus Omnitrophota bacterium]
MKDPVAIILAAGRGTRMRSDMPKVLHTILGKPIIRYVLDSVNDAGISDAIVVAGFGHELLREELVEAKIVVQEELLGSGDAVNTAGRALKDYSGDILVICGDTPLIRARTIRNMLQKHKSSGASVTILTAKLSDPTGYGRIIRDDKGAVTGIVEQEKADLCQEVINEINVGTYCFKAAELFEALDAVKPDNKKKEIFLTDTISILKNKGKLIESYLTQDPDEAIGVNTRIDLAYSTAVMKGRIAKELMLGGVTIEDPASTVIYPGVKIGKDTTIRSNTVIEAGVEIGEGCTIGPFTRIRPKVSIGDNVEVGNFVELNRTTVGSDSKIKHHSYLGDAVIGKKVNIGAGTITANYDGKNKNKTIIEDGAFIGVGAVLIAPIKIGAMAMVGAGSVVPKNHDVPKGKIVVGVPARIYKKRKPADRRIKKNRRE